MTHRPTAHTYTGPVLMLCGSVLPGKRYASVDQAADACVRRLSYLTADCVRSDVRMNRDAYGAQIWTPAT